MAEGYTHIPLSMAERFCPIYYIYIYVHGAMELRVFTVVAFCTTYHGGGFFCKLWLRSTPRYLLVCNWFPPPGGGVPVRTWPGLGPPSVQVQD